MVCPSNGAEQTLPLEEDQHVEFSVSVYMLGGESEVILFVLDKLCFGLSVGKMKRLCLVVPASEETAGTAQEKRTAGAGGGIM